MCWAANASTRNQNGNIADRLSRSKLISGDIVLVDSTNFTTLFGGTESLKNFWHNLATMK